jgi:hypothetical protein
MSRYEALYPFITDSVRELARNRLFNALKFHEGKTLKKEFNKADVKAALLLIKIINPREFLTGAEREMIEGCQRKTITNKRQTFTNKTL